MNTLQSPHFLLVGHDGSHNRGCEALVRSTISILRDEYPQARFTVASRHPESDRPLLDIEELDIIPGFCRLASLYQPQSSATTDRVPAKRKRSLIRRGLNALLPHGLVVAAHYRARETQRKQELARPSQENQFTRVRHLKEAMLSADLVISIGGDTFIEDYGPPTYYLELLEYAQFLRRKTMVWGASVWSFKDKQIESRLKQTFAACDLITIRDQLSVDYLASLGITENVRLVGDGAFLMPPRASDRVNINWGTTPQTVLGFNGTQLLIAEHEKLAPSLVEAIRTLIDDHDFGVVLIPHDAPPGAHERDLLFEIAKLVDRPDATYFVPLGLDGPETKAVMGQCDLFLAMRFHPSIAALSQAIPTIGLGYSPKFEGLHRAVYGHTDHLIAFDDVSVDRLLKKVLELRENRHAVHEQLVSRIPELQDMAKLNGMYIRQMFDGTMNRS